MTVDRPLLRPAPDDFAMLRLVLLAFLPQIGGVLLMWLGGPFSRKQARMSNRSTVLNRQR